MRRPFPVLLAAAIALVAAGSARADSEPMAGNTQFLVGQRYLGDFWKPLDQQALFGIETDFAPRSSPVRVAFAAIGSADKRRVTTPFYGETGEVGADVAELSAGFLWQPLKKGVVRPYLGAGLSLVYAGIGTDYFDRAESDQSFGFYGNLGVFFKVGDTFNVGLDGRIVRGTRLTLAGVDGDADYEQLSLLLGFSWGP
jgi:Outer membrane protein beta-barrel domain